MGTGYVRNDASNNIDDDKVINASDFDGEFDAIVAAFDASTGHTHDGTSAEGAPIEVTGPAQEYLFDDTAVYPKADNTYDLGKSSAKFKDLHLTGTASVGALVAGTATIDAGTLDVDELTADTVTIEDGTITDLTVTGDVDFSGVTNKSALLNALGFSGMILIWSGTIGSIPAGWALCDGTNGTPDLTDKFVLGAGDSYSVGDSGGTSSITNVPSHSHNSGNLSTGDAGSHNHNANTSNAGNHSHNVSGNTNNTGSHSHNVSGNTNNTGSHSHSIRASQYNISQSSFGNFDSAVYRLRDARNNNSGDSGRTDNSGSHSHNVSGNTNSTGSHSHNVSGNTSNTGGHNHNISVSNVGDHTHSISGDTGTTGDSSVSVLNPYYALAFIMKV